MSVSKIVAVHLHAFMVYHYRQIQKKILLLLGLLHTLANTLLLRQSYYTISMKELQQKVCIE